MNQIPSIGRVVHYVLSQYDADQINRPRTNGNTVVAGEHLPMIITKVDLGDTHGVSGRVFLDGNDLYWVQSRAEGQEPATWHWPERV